MTYQKKMDRPHFFEPGCDDALPELCWGCGRSAQDILHLPKLAHQEEESS
jgi:hypothetical protein